MTGFSSYPLMPDDASPAAAGTALSWRGCGRVAGREDAPYSAQDGATSTCTTDWNGNGDGGSDEAKKEEEKDFDFYDDEDEEEVEDMEDDEDVVLGEDDFEEE